MKRYFDIPEQKLALKLDIIDGSEAATADVKEFEKHFKTKMREVNKPEYNRLVVEYGGVK